MTGIRQAVALLALVLPLLIPATGIGAVAGDDPCPSSSSNSLEWIGDVHAEAETIPSLERPGTEYQATVVSPADLDSRPGPRPVVVLQHGIGGDRCNLWWLAVFLAGRGYVTEVHSSPLNGNAIAAYQAGRDATRSAIARLRRINAEPGRLRGRIDLDRLGLAGHSMGSIIVSELQGEAALGVKAVVVTDTLRRYTFGDPGGAVSECATPPVPESEVIPLVPALSFAKDGPCAARPDHIPADLKLTGPRWWTGHGIPNMQLVMRGYEHRSFGDGASGEQKRRLAGWIWPWFERWLNHDRSQEESLLAPVHGGQPTTEILSSRFLSSACLPGGPHTEDLASWFGGSRDRAGGPCDRFDPPKPRLTRLKLVKPRVRPRPGGRWTLSLRVMNAGHAPARKARVRLRTNRSRLRLPRPVVFRRVAPGTVATLELRLRIPRRMRGTVVVTAKHGKLKARTSTRIRGARQGD